MSFSEVLDTVNEVVTVLSSVEDEEALEILTKRYDEIHKVRSLQQDDVKSVIQGLSKLLTEKEEEEKLSKLDENSSGVESLQEETKIALQHIEKLEVDVKVLEKNITEKEGEISELKKKASQVESNDGEVLPQAKYNFSLYSNVSHIRWDYECEDDLVKGFVASLSDVKPFCLRKSEKSNYDIANYLWELVEA